MFNKLTRIFRLSDIFLVFWLVFGMLIFLDQNAFIVNLNPAITDFSKPLYLYIMFYILMLSSFFVYALLEHRKKSFTISIPLLILFFVFIISEIEAIYLTPNNVSLLLYEANGSAFTVNEVFSIEAKTVHFFAISFIITALYIFLIIFPKRVTNIKFIEYFTYAFYLLAIIAIIYSLCKDDYIFFFKVLLGKEETVLSLKELSPVSFFGNQNTFGMFFEVLILVSLLNFTLTGRKYNLFLCLFFYIYLIVTLCKTGLISITFVLFLYCLIHLILFIRNHNKKGIVFCSCVIGAMMIGVVSLLIFASVSNGSLGILNINTIFTDRTEIWYSSIQIIKSTSIIRGGGYGVYELLLKNATSNYLIFKTPVTHNWFFAILCKGGLIFLIPYIGLLIYSVWIIVRLYKNNKNIILLLAASEATFFIHSFFEDNYNLVIGVIAVLFVYKNIVEHESEQSN